MTLQKHDPVTNMALKCMLYNVLICAAGMFFSDPVNVPALCFIPVAYLALIWSADYQCRREMNKLFVGDACEAS